MSAAFTMTNFDSPLTAGPITADFACVNPGKLLINAVTNPGIVP